MMIAAAAAAAAVAAAVTAAVAAAVTAATAVAAAAAVAAAVTAAAAAAAVAPVMEANLMTTTKMMGPVMMTPSVTTSNTAKNLFGKTIKKKGMIPQTPNHQRRDTATYFKAMMTAAVVRNPVLLFLFQLLILPYLQYITHRVLHTMSQSTLKLFA